MSGLIYFRFRNALQSEQVAFDGHFITIGELKHLIAVKKGLGREAAAELILSDQNNTIEYNDDKQQLAKMSKVFVRRAPPKSKPLVGATPAPEVPAAKPETTAEASTADDDVFGGDVFADQAAALDAELQRVGAVAEAEARAQAQASVSGIGRGGRGMAGDRGRGRSGAGEGRGGGGGRGTAGPPPTYRCNKCAGFGHWQKDCPANDDPNLEVRRIRNPAGIPVTMLRRNADGSLILPNGEVGGLAPNAKAFEAATAAYRPTPPPMREPTPPPAVTAAAAPPAALPAPVQAPLEPAPPMLALMPPLADFGFPSYSSAAEPPPRRVRSPSPLHQHMGALVNEGVLPFAPPQVLAEAFAGPPLSKEEFERIKALGALPGMPRAGDGGGRHSRSPRRDRRSRSRERRSRSRERRRSRSREPRQRSRERRRSRSRERRPASPPLQGAMFYGVRPPRSPVVSRQRSPPRAAAAQRAPFVAPVVEDSRPREPSPEEAMDDTWMY